MVNCISGLGYLDFGLLLTWWTFLYVFVVLPWMYATPTLDIYNTNYNVLTYLQHFLITIGFAVCWLRTKGAWRTVYFHLFGATALYMLDSLITNIAIAKNSYYTGSWYDLPMMTAFFWYGIAGVIAFQKRDALDAPMDSDDERLARDYVWASRFAMAAVLSLPLFALYALRIEHDTLAVKDFRLTVTLVAALPLALLVFLRTHLADADRARLLARSESSIENLQRLQAQMVQSGETGFTGTTGRWRRARDQQSIDGDSWLFGFIGRRRIFAGARSRNRGENPRAGAADEEPGAESFELRAASAIGTHAAGYQYSADECGATAGAGSA